MGELWLYDRRLKKLTKNDLAISESFTLFPSLAMVLVGFTIFSIIIVSAYTTFDNKQDTIDMFELSESVLRKVSSPTAIFTVDANHIDLQMFTSDQASLYIQDLQHLFIPYDFYFVLKLTCDDTIAWSPEPAPEPVSMINRYASSKHVSVRTNEVTTIPGVLTIVFWKDST